jgi:DNA-binding CsgD family transcriptional regulator
MMLDQAEARTIDAPLLRRIDAQLAEGLLRPALAELRRSAGSPWSAPARAAVTSRLAHALLAGGRADEAAAVAARALAGTGLDRAARDDLQAARLFALSLADPLARRPIDDEQHPRGAATLAVRLSILAGHYRRSGDVDRAMTVSARAVDAAAGADLPAWYALVALHHARRLLAVGAGAEAAALIAQAQASCAAPGPAAAYATIAELVAGEALLPTGAVLEAGELAERVLREARNGEVALALPHAHRLLAEVALRTESWDKARRHVHAIRVLLETGAIALWPLHPHWLDAQITLRQYGSQACARLLTADRYWLAGDTALAAEHPAAPLWFARTGRELHDERLVEAAVATAQDLARRNPRTPALAALAERVCEAAGVAPSAGAAPQRREFTPTERTIVSLVADGLTNVQIAHRVGLSAHTVNYHLRKVYRRLRINSRVELVRVADKM